MTNGNVIVNLELKLTKVSLNAETGVADVEGDLYIDKILRQTFPMKFSMVDGEFQLVKSAEEE